MILKERMIKLSAILLLFMSKTALVCLSQQLCKLRNEKSPHFFHGEGFLMLTDDITLQSLVYLIV